MRTARTFRRFALLALTALAVGPASARDRDAERLPARYRQWLDEVEPLIQKEERRSFLALAEDYQRDRFIEAFWKARDPVPATQVNEFKVGFEARRLEAPARYGSMRADQARIYLTNGEPSLMLDFPKGCALLLWPIQIWRYRSSPVVNRDFTLLFYAPYGGRYRLWRPQDGFAALTALPACEEAGQACGQQLSAFVRLLQDRCKIPDEIAEISQALREIEVTASSGVFAAELPPRPADEEWLTTFRSFDTGVEDAAGPLEATVALSYPARHQSRTVVRGDLAVARSGLAPIVLGGTATYGLELTGELLLGDSLFESFRYRYEIPAAGDSGAPVGVSFDRYLRPGDYTLVVKLEDLGSRRAFGDRIALSVPRVEDEAPGASAAAGTTAGEAAGRARIRIVAPRQEVLTGSVRFEAEVAGEAVRSVEFLLDDRSVLTKTRPPFSVELGLGAVPRRSVLRAVARDAGGTELATDELVLNAGRNAFAVRLVEPRRGGTFSPGPMEARAEVLAPDGAGVESLELFLGDRRLAVLYQEPWVHRFELPAGDGLAYVRAVATLADGRTAEDLVVVRGSPFGEEVDVRAVEVWATVVDRAGRPVRGLVENDFELAEDGRPQRLLRFAESADQPFHAVLMIDTSASMEERIDGIRKAGFALFDDGLGAGDRAAIVTFSNQPRVAVPFTGEAGRVAGALASIKPEQSTALWDSVVFSLQYLAGIQGPRALVVLSDGRDQRSTHSYDNVVELARRSGVTIYTFAYSTRSPAALTALVRLRRLAEETGGRHTTVADDAELAAGFRAIAEELRSRYLLVYQAPEGGPRGAFRTIDLRLRRPDLEARAMRGYLP